MNIYSTYPISSSNSPDLDLDLDLDIDLRPLTSSSTASLAYTTDLDFSLEDLTPPAMPSTPRGGEDFINAMFGSTPSGTSSIGPGAHGSGGHGVHAHPHPVNMAELSDSASPADFAFEPPPQSADHQGQHAHYHYSPSSGTPSGNGNGVGQKLVSPDPATGLAVSGGYAFPPPPDSMFALPGYQSSSISSASGSATGSSFSSVDALPAISRNFTRPTPTETRRPATAGGALQGGRFSGFVPNSGVGDNRLGKTTRSEEDDDVGGGVFQDPFISPTDTTERQQQQQPPQQQQQQVMQTADIDPHYVPENSWSQPQQPVFASGYPLTSAPPNMSNFNFIQFHGMARPSSLNRPQTSDGLPSYPAHFGGNVPLPSARTIVNQIDGYMTSSPYTTVPPSSLLPYREHRPVSMGDIHGSAFSSRPYSMDNRQQQQMYVMTGGDKTNDSDGLTFVPLGGPTPKKRPRRRYDEIERLYLCGFRGCEKAYGTLNHLNAHVAMQKHGEKRLPTEFKEMRKAWRKKKREQVASGVGGHYSGATSWGPRGSVGSTSSDSDERRASLYSISSESGDPSDPYNRAATSYGTYNAWQQADGRPTTGSSIASSTDGRFAYTPFSTVDPMAQSVPSTMNMNRLSGQQFARRATAPSHVSLPQQTLQQGFRPAEGDYPTPTPQNPNPSVSANNRGSGYPFIQAPAVQQFQQFTFQR